MRAAFQATRKWFAAHPFTANIASSALVFSTGDALCQIVERRFPPQPNATDPDRRCCTLPVETGKVSLPDSRSLDALEPYAPCSSSSPVREPIQADQPYDLPRILRATAFGTGISVWLQFWWGFLQNTANSVVPVARYSKAANILFVVAFDQAVGASIVNGGYFFTVSFLADWDVNKALERVGACWGPQMLLHLSFWPWFSVGLFWFAKSISARLLIRNIVFAGWSGIMSYRNHAHALAQAANQKQEFLAGE